MAVTKISSVPLPGGPSANVYDLTNPNGMRARVTNVGCAIMELHVPDRAGVFRDVVFGFKDPVAYTVNPSFFGVVVGRVANRIKGAAFELDGKVYALEANDGVHHLHGGSDGFDKKAWAPEIDGEKLILTLRSPDGDAGYPGELTACVTYELRADNTLRIEYKAVTPTKTVCNLTNHSYFNLNGHSAGFICGHEAVIHADRITAVDADLIPTGAFTDVTGTPYDFRVQKPLGRDMEAAGGYDNNYVLNGAGIAALVRSPESGVTLEVRTDSPGIQLYTGNMLTGDVQGKDGAYYPKHTGFCLETQIFPDAVHQSAFPSCVVEAGKPMRYWTEFKFGVA